MSDGEQPRAIVAPAAAALLLCALATIAYDRWNVLDWRDLALLSARVLAAGPVACRPIYAEARTRWAALQGERRGWLRGVAIVYGALGVLALAWLLVWQVPQWQVPAEQVPSGNERRLELVNEYRRTWAGILGGITVLLTLAVAWRRAEAAVRGTRAIEQGQLTERFTRAIDQLGAMKGDQRNVEVRLGGIYALEQIARDAPDKYHWQIMEVLSAYVRENHRFREYPVLQEPEMREDRRDPEREANAKVEIPNRLDVQAAISVIARRIAAHDNGRDIDLGGTDLRGYDLSGAYLSGANLEETSLDGAKLEGANLMFARLRMANLETAKLRWALLQGANLYRARLRGAKLDFARLDGALLESAYMQGAYLHGACLVNASLNGAYLTGATLAKADLTRANLNGARLLWTRLEGALRPADDLREVGWVADGDGYLHRQEDGGER